MNPRDDLPFAILSANAYHPAPLPGVQRIVFQDISADIAGDTCAIRGTNSFATLMRDFNIEGKLDYTHPTLGPMQSGAYLAARGLLALLPPGIETFTGHSEAGGIAPILGWREAGRCGDQSVVAGKGRAVARLQGQSRVRLAFPR
jgi:hypothetical protein